MKHCSNCSSLHICVIKRRHSAATTLLTPSSLTRSTSFSAVSRGYINAKGKVDTSIFLKAIKSWTHREVGSLKRLHRISIHSSVRLPIPKKPPTFLSSCLHRGDAYLSNTTITLLRSVSGSSMGKKGLTRLHS